MFIQIITGRTDDPEAFVRNGESWQKDVRPGAIGYLGTTMGVAENGRTIIAARFESPEAAQANSERPEQGAFFEKASKVMRDIEFHHASRVITLLGGGRDDAGFVQVMCGRITDRAKAEALLARMDEAVAILAKARPDVVGEVIALHDGADTYTDIVYFSSQAEARANEAKGWPPDAQKIMDEMQEAMEVTEFIDLGSPHLH